MIFGLKQIAVDGLGPLSAAAIAAGLLIGAWFVHRQRTLTDPLVDLSLFNNRAFNASLAVYFLGILFVFGLSYYTAQYLQLVLGLSPFIAGVWTIPGVVAFIVSSNLAPRIVRHIRPGFLMAGGLALAAFGVGLLTQVGASSLSLLVLGNVIMSLGFGPVITLATDVVVGSAPPERAGAASGLSETSAELGGALGIAVLGSIGAAIYRGQVTAALPAGLPPRAIAAAQETLGGAVVAAELLPGNLAAPLLSTSRAAFVQGLQTTALIGAVGLAAMAIVAAFLLRHVQTRSGQVDEAPQTSDAFSSVRTTDPLEWAA